VNGSPAQAQAAAPRAPALPSLRSRLQRRVLLPLALTWLLGSAGAAAVAYVFTQRAFDRSLLDDAYAVAAHVTETPDGEVALNLSPSEIGSLLFDQSERVFFAVRRADGLLVAGHAGLPMAPAEPDRLWEFSDRFFNGAALRVVTLRREPPQDFVVAVGQTVHSRTLVLQRLLALCLLPQALLRAGLGLWLRRTIGGELQPLQRLQDALRARRPSDLSPVQVAGRTRDVAQLADAASALLARIAAGVRSQREFAGNVAHELRTPLAGIRSLAEFGLAQSDPAVWRAQLQAIRGSEERASHLVDQLLALARADESCDGLQLLPLRLDELVRALLLRLMPRADTLGVDLGAEGLDRACTVRGHPALLEGLLSNLLDNALRYGRPRQPGVAPCVTVELAPVAAGRVRLSVRDNGPGLADGTAGDGEPGELDRWRRGAGSSDAQGAGLGLSICRRYAELLGARLLLERGAAGGLSASIELVVVDGGGAA
jgi:two-component system sensor histidine kinase TctE